MELKMELKIELKKEAENELKMELKLEVKSKTNRYNQSEQSGVFLECQLVWFTFTTPDSDSIRALL